MFLLSKIESLDYFQAMAALHNPQLSEVSKVRELAKMNLRLHRAEFFPEIAAIGGMVFCNYQLSPLVPRMAVGVGLNFKIFDAVAEIVGEARARQFIEEIGNSKGYAKSKIEYISEGTYKRYKWLIRKNIAKRMYLH